MPFYFAKGEDIVRHMCFQKRPQKRALTSWERKISNFGSVSVEHTLFTSPVKRNSPLHGQNGSFGPRIDLVIKLKALISTW